MKSIFIHQITEFKSMFFLLLIATLRGIFSETKQDKKKKKAGFLLMFHLATPYNSATSFTHM